MSSAPVQPVTAAISRLREWQQLYWTATNHAIGHYLHGCADLAMARTPRQALAAVRKTQRGLLKHSADTIAEATWLWRKQNTESRGDYGALSRPPASSARSMKD